MTETFNKDLWYHLLKLDLLHETPNKRKLMEEYDLSLAIVNAHLFAFNNRLMIPSEVTSFKKEAILQKKLADKTKLTTQLLHENHMLQAMLDVNLALNVIEKNIIVEPFKTVEKVYDDENTAITLFSDSHFEETVLEKTVLGINTYNIDEATLRVRRYFKRVLFLIHQHQKGGVRIKHLVLALLGDIINGYIHEEYVENNQLSPIEASYEIELLLIAGIKQLASSGLIDSIVIPCCRGNHGRTTAKKRYSTGFKNSYEQLIYKHLDKYFRDTPGYENVKFVLSDSEFTSIKIYDKTWAFHHGDAFQYRGGVGGLMVPMNRWLLRMQQILPADMYAMAHWHTQMSLPNTLNNGSIIGYTPYALGIAASPEIPQQQFQLQDIKRGFTSTTRILLTDW